MRNVKQLLPLLLILLGTGIWLLLFSSPNSADAQSVTLTPVICTIPGQVSGGELDNFYCKYMDQSGTFSAVPDGQYLHVTDVLITPRHFPETNAHYVAFVHLRSSADAYKDSRSFSSNAPHMTKMSSTMPLLIASPTDYFSAESIDFSGQIEPTLDVDIIGYLSSEPKVFLPLVSRQ